MVLLNMFIYSVIHTTYQFNFIIILKNMLQKYLLFCKPNCSSLFGVRMTIGTLFMKGLNEQNNYLLDFLTYTQYCHLQ